MMMGWKIYSPIWSISDVINYYQFNYLKKINTITQTLKIVQKKKKKRPCITRILINRFFFFYVILTN